MKPKSMTMLHLTKVENTYQDPKYKLEIKEYIIKTNILVSQAYWLRNVGEGAGMNQSWKAHLVQRSFNAISCILKWVVMHAWSK